MFANFVTKDNRRTATKSIAIYMRRKDGDFPIIGNPLSYCIAFKLATYERPASFYPHQASLIIKSLNDQELYMPQAFTYHDIVIPMNTANPGYREDELFRRDYA